jgi:hypothetical protein
MSQNEEETKAPEENPSTETEVGATDAGESNPFTSDLKGEFTSSFGTETNTVSQLLSDGAFGAKRNKVLMAAGAAVFAIFIGVLVMSSGDESAESDEFGNSETLEDVGDDFAEEDDSDLGKEGDETEDLLENDIEIADTEIEEAESIEEEVAEEKAIEEEERIAEAEEKRKLEEQGEALASADGEGLEGEMTEDGMDPNAEEVVDPAAVVDTDAPIEGLEGTDRPAALNPPSGSSRSYDETSEYAEFSWEGSPGGYIYFSRNPNLEPVEKRVMVDGNNYRLRHPWPGTWYWKVQNGAGASEIASFTVDPAVRRNVALNQPQSGSSLSGNGGLVSWTGDSKVARYKVEISGSGWANPDYKFQTSGNDLQVQGVSVGNYQMRVGAFSEVSGRWEFTQPVDVVVE